VGRNKEGIKETGKKNGKGEFALPVFFVSGLLFHSRNAEALCSPGFSLERLSFEQLDKSAQALGAPQRGRLIFQFEFVAAVETTELEHGEPTSFACLYPNVDTIIREKR
jgi:hypothetical protein